MGKNAINATINDDNVIDQKTSSSTRPVISYLSASQIINKRHKTSVSAVLGLNVSFDTRLSRTVHSTAGAGPIWLSQLISHPCIQKSRCATRCRT
jgi:hypothetical protein